MISGQGGEGQGETARGRGLKSENKRNTTGARGRVHPWSSFVFIPWVVFELLFSKNALLRSLWAELRLQLVVAQGLLPYLELLTKGLVSPGFSPKEEGFSHLLSHVAKTQPAEEGSRLGSALPTTWYLSH